MASSRALLVVPPLFLSFWIAWHALVLRPASRRIGRFGPSWMSWLLSSTAYFVAKTLMRIPFKVNLEDARDRGVLDKQVMVAFHPHGAFAGSETQRTIREVLCECVADVVFRIPGISEFLLINNSRAADRTTMSKLLRAGHSVAVQPGGIYEQVRWDPEVERIYFPPNLGFIRVALEHGVPILPIYVFGENSLYTQNSVTRALNAFMYSNFGAGVCFVCGRYGLPWFWPRRVPLSWVFGELLEVGEPVKDPSDEKVKEVFLQYIEKLRKIWDANASSMLPKSSVAAGLQVVWRGHEDEII